MRQRMAIMNALSQESSLMSGHTDAEKYGKEAVPKLLDEGWNIWDYMSTSETTVLYILEKE